MLCCMRYCGLQEYVLTVDEDVFVRLRKQRIFSRDDEYGDVIIIKVTGWRAVEELRDIAGPISPGAAVMFRPKRSHAKCYVGYTVRQKKMKQFSFVCIFLVLDRNW